LSISRLVKREQKKKKDIKRTSQRMARKEDKCSSGFTNMAEVPLFWDTNIGATTSFENNPKGINSLILESHFLSSKKEDIIKRTY